MFNQPPEEEPPKTSRVPSKKRNKRKKKSNINRQHNFKRDKRKHTKIGCPMSSWAENFAMAATWQLKHQVAYWKARAKSLEYENKLLHDIIRKRHTVPSSETRESTLSDSDSSYDTQIDDAEITEEEHGDNFEVSEEFIQFLTANAKYKEDARRERERLKALQDAEDSVDVKMEEAPEETAEDRQRTWEQLYGDGWQRISTLEMLLHSHFINECDRSKPGYWPNIPLNLSS